MGMANGGKSCSDPVKLAVLLRGGEKSTLEPGLKGRNIEAQVAANAEACVRI